MTWVSTLPGASRRRGCPILWHLGHSAAREGLCVRSRDLALVGPGPGPHEGPQEGVDRGAEVLEAVAAPSWSLDSQDAHTTSSKSDELLVGSPSYHVTWITRHAGRRVVGTFDRGVC